MSRPNPFERIPTYPNIDDSWRIPWLEDFLRRVHPTSARPSRATLLLGGGGAKGCFQAGAMAFLADNGDARLQPNLVCGTSVGAVNGILATENRNSPDNSRMIRLVEVWLGLEETRDFFVPSDELLAVEGEIPGLLKSIAGFDLVSLGTTLLSDGYNVHQSEIPEWVITGHTDWTHPVLLGLYGTTAATLGNLTSFATIAASIYAANRTEDTIDAFGRLRSFYTLDPVRSLIRENMDESLLRLEHEGPLRERVKAGDRDVGNIELRMVSVEATTGALCWVDNRGYYNEIEKPLLSRRIAGLPQTINTHQDLFRAGGYSTGAGGLYPMPYAERIEEGTIGSAAIPVAFDPGVIHLTNSAAYRPRDVATLFDGGVHDVLPVQASIDYLTAANELGLDNIVISIPTAPVFDAAPFFRDHLGPLGVMEPPGFMGPLTKYWDVSDDRLDIIRSSFPDDDVQGTQILNVALWGIAQQGAEVGRTDLIELDSLPFEVDELLIAPTFNVNGSGQIDKGLIRIQLAYGWMRACDMVLLRQIKKRIDDGELEETDAAFGPFFEAYESTDLITRYRMNCWRQEMRYTPITGRFGFPEEVTFEENVIPIVRGTKVLIADQIRRRSALFTTSGLTPFPTVTYMPDNQPQDWLDFEKHSRESFWFASIVDEEDTAIGDAAYAFLDANSLWTTSFRVRGGPSTHSGEATRPVL